MKAAVLAAEGLKIHDPPMRASGGKGVDPIVDQAIFVPPRIRLKRLDTWWIRASKYVSSRCLW